MTIRFFPSKVIFADKLHHVSAEIKQSIRGGLYYLWLLHVGVKSVTRLARKIKLSSLFLLYRTSSYKDVISYFNNSQCLE